MATETAWNQLATDLGCITPYHMVANITGLKNRQVFLPHPVQITQRIIKMPDSTNLVQYVKGYFKKNLRQKFIF